MSGVLYTRKWYDPWPGMSRSDRSAPVRVGDIIAGKYRVEKLLGAGGMGVVVSARHLKLGDERVAIKFLHSRSLSDSMRCGANANVSAQSFGRPYLTTAS